MPNHSAKIFLEKNIFNIWFSPRTIVTLQRQNTSTAKNESNILQYWKYTGGGVIPFLYYLFSDRHIYLCWQ